MPSRRPCSWPKTAEGRASGLSPALLARIVKVRAAYDLRIRARRLGDGSTVFERVPEPGALSEGAYRGLVSPIRPSALRDPAMPAVQIALNLQLITEAEATLSLMPPFLEPAFRDWPGSLVCGRFPLRAWPRALNAVLEWQDPERDWVIRRGEGLAYLAIDLQRPDARLALFEAALTPALKRHFARIDNVSVFGRNVAPMFAEAAARRPVRLLERKAIAADAARTAESPAAPPADTHADNPADTPTDSQPGGARCPASSSTA